MRVGTWPRWHDGGVVMGRHGGVSSVDLGIVRASKPSDIFPERLRTAREHRELSQGELADRAGLQASAVSHFETAGRKPSFDNLKKLADALNVSTDYLLGRTAEMEGLAKTGDRLHRHYAGLSSEYQEMADEFLEMLAQKAKGTRKTGD